MECGFNCSLTDKVREILFDLFLLTYSNSKKAKNQISKGLISHYLNNFLPCKLYCLQSIQSIRLDPWNTYNTPLSFYRILNSSYSAAFYIFVSLFPFFCSDSTSFFSVSLYFHHKGRLLVF